MRRRRGRERQSQPRSRRQGPSVTAEVKLARERKHLTDIIEMIDQAESDFVMLLRPHYARVDQEGRTLLHELFAATGDIRVPIATAYHLHSAPHTERSPLRPSNSDNPPPALACGADNAML